VTFPRFNLLTKKTEKSDLWKVVKTWPTTFDNAKQENGTLTADLVGGPDNKPVGKLEAHFDHERFSYRVEWTGPKTEVQELGWAIDMPASADQFSWDRAARWTVYPDKHIGRPSGTATPESMNVHYSKWDRLDAFDFNSTKYDCNWASLSDKAGNGVRVEFDARQRFHCRGGVSGDKAKNVLFVNQQVSPPDDISTNIVRDLCMTLNPGDKISGSFRVGSNAKGARLVRRRLRRRRTRLDARPQHRVARPVAPLRPRVVGADVVEQLQRERVDPPLPHAHPRAGWPRTPPCSGPAPTPRGTDAPRRRISRPPPAPARGCSSVPAGAASTSSHFETARPPRTAGRRGTRARRGY
jgi:hypothetical protein